METGNQGQDMEQMMKDGHETTGIGYNNFDPTAYHTAETETMGDDIMQEPEIPTMQVNPQSALFENLAPKLSEAVLVQIGADVVKGYEDDEDSRTNWKTAYEIFTREWYVRPEHDQKTEPWPKSSNMVLPVINIACTQFWARSLDAIFSSKEVVKALPNSFEPSIALAADRVAKHMNYQINYKMENFYEGMSKSLMQLPLSGTVIRKTFYDPITKENCSDFVSPLDFVVNYNTRYLEKSRRYTHVLHETISDILIKGRDGTYANTEQVGLQSGTTIVNATNEKESADKNIGMTPPSVDDFMYRDVLEQHVYMAIFDDNGNAVNMLSSKAKIMKPYIITVDKQTQKVLRIIDREIMFNGKKTLMSYFTKYGFIPSPDDGFYDVGFGMLLYRPTSAMNTLINQLVDAGTLQNSQSGFISRQLNLKRGQVVLTRGQFTEVNASGGDIKQGIYPLQFQPPSQVLFQLLGMLQDYTNKLTTVSDMFTGEMPRSDTSATAVINLIEQGLKVFSSIYKSLHRSFGKELQKIYKLNGVYLDETEYFSIVSGADDAKTMGVDPNQLQSVINKSDYQHPFEIIPVSDPGVISKTERVAKAQLNYQTVMQNPLTSQQPLVMFRALEDYLKAYNENPVIVDKLLEPIKQQMAMQEQAMQQQHDELMMKQQGLQIMQQQLAQGGVPPQMIEQMAKEQHIGAQMIQEQMAQQLQMQGEAQNSSQSKAKSGEAQQQIAAQ